ncbi:phage major capsid protein [Nocardia terpenica]|uniref:phage major capsid protein n=1 Tax=Nocardia terpenica TaxID=455432 RepID=UPI002FE1638B
MHPTITNNQTEDERLIRVRANREATLAKRNAILAAAAEQKREYLTEEQDTEFRALTEELKMFDERIEDLTEEAERMRRIAEGSAAIYRARASSASNASAWATSTARALRSMSPSYTRAIVSGSVEVPALLSPAVVSNPHPTRLIDLLTNRQGVDSNSFSFVRQTVRTNQAAPVPDHGVKPTSVFTVTGIEDRLRVIAHLSEPVPLRLFEDDNPVALEDWLRREMAEGVLDALEHQFVAGDGSGENFTGLLHTAGVTTVPYGTAILPTLRRARTQLQMLSERPSAWVLNPLDAEQIDLMREGAEGRYLGNGYADPRTDNVFGDITRITSNSVPAGTALLADWSQVRLIVRHGVRIDVDAGGELFARNEAVLRAEGRFGLAVLRPQAVAVVSLTGKK